MSYTNTQSSTFTRTHASYIASKIAADLRQMQRFYGKPSDTEIDDYVTELVELLVGGYLDSVEYGYRIDGRWVVALSYTVYSNGLVSTDDNSGRVPPGADVKGATWYSYLRKNQKFSALPAADQARVTGALPVKRTPATEPQAGNGVWTQDKAYSSNGTAAQRRTFKPL